MYEIIDRCWTVGELIFFSNYDDNEYGMPNITGIQLIHHYNGRAVGFLRVVWAGSEIFCALVISYEGFVGFQLLELPWFSVFCLAISVLDGNVDFNLGLGRFTGIGWTDGGGSPGHISAKERK